MLLLKLGSLFTSQVIKLSVDSLELYFLTTKLYEELLDHFCLLLELYISVHKSFDFILRE